MFYERVRSLHLSQLVHVEVRSSWPKVFLWLCEFEDLFQPVPQLLRTFRFSLQAWRFRSRPSIRFPLWVFWSVAWVDVLLSVNLTFQRILSIQVMPMIPTFEVLPKGISLRASLLKECVPSDIQIVMQQAKPSILGCRVRKLLHSPSFPTMPRNLAIFHKSGLLQYKPSNWALCWCEWTSVWLQSPGLHGCLTSSQAFQTIASIGTREAHT